MRCNNCDYQIGDKFVSLINNTARKLAASQGSDDWDTLDEPGRERFRVAVRAVIEALREPDEQMTEAGAEIIRNVGPSESDVAYLSDAANTWRFMIDALLGERA